jgi:hypothetical protein
MGVSGVKANGESVTHFMLHRNMEVLGLRVHSLTSVVILLYAEQLRSCRERGQTS